jgi:leucyl-tRNA synthetase
MFMGPFEDSAVWNTESIIGSRRFIEKVWRIGQKIVSEPKSSSAGSLSTPTGAALTLGLSACERPCRENFSSLSKLLNKTIKKVGEDIEDMHFNTAISAMMILATEMEKEQGRTLNPQKSPTLNLEDFKKFLQILAPFAPHLAEEIWHLLGEKKSIHFSAWPKYDKKLIRDDKIKIAVQVNGKVRAEIMIRVDESEEDIKKKALENDAVFRFMAGAEPRKVIYVKNRLVNIVA